MPQLVSATGQSRATWAHVWPFGVIKATVAACIAASSSLHGGRCGPPQLPPFNTSSQGAIMIVGALRRQLLGTPRVRHRRHGGSDNPQSLPRARSLSTPAPHYVRFPRSNAARHPPAPRISAQPGRTTHSRQPYCARVSYCVMSHLLAKPAAPPVSGILSAGSALIHPAVSGILAREAFSRSGFS